MFPKVTIIIVYFNRADLTIQTIRSAQKINYPNYDILLVNNGSTEEEERTVKEAFPKIETVHIQSNNGFDIGFNAGVKAALAKNADYIFLSSNDLQFDSELLTKLVETGKKDRRIGIVGLAPYESDKPDQIAYSPACYISNWWFGTRKGISLGEIKNSNGKNIHIDYIPGNMLISAQMIKEIGSFDEKLFLYFEEIDFGLRAQKAGYTLAVAPEAKLWHSMSDKTHGRINRYFSARNEPRVFLRNIPKKYHFTYLLWYFLRMGGYIFVFFGYGLLSGKWLNFKIFTLAVKDFLTNNYGKGSIEKLLAYQKRSDRENG